MLRKPTEAGVVPASMQPGAQATFAPQPGAYQAVGTTAGKNSPLLNALKEELFALESEKISGKITAEEYAQVKGALEIVLKRALKHNS